MMVKIGSLITGIMILLFSNFVQAQSQFSGQKRTLLASHTTLPVKIDGQLTEKAWSVISLADSFIQIEPEQGEPAKYPTVVKILYDEKNLYIGAFCYDSAGRKGIRTTELKRDFTASKSDIFSFCIDAFNDKRSNMTFATNPYGPQYDYLNFDALLTDADWNGLWKVRTSINDSGWIAEFEIPWKTLRYRHIDSIQTWGINFYRLRRLSNEVSVWSSYPRSYSFDRMEFAGILTGIKPPPPSANFQLNQYFLTSYSKVQNLGNEIKKFNQKIGGDIKWAIRSNAVLDITVNTDFAQADADIAVNNVTRFSVLFPERRQFFLENASLFSPGLNGTGGSMFIYPFITRTIGLSNGTPIPIKGGARFVNRSPKQNFGAMVMRQGESGENPMTHFAVGRYSKNISKQSRIGVLLGLKSASGNATNSSYNNFTESVDGFFRFDKTNSLSTMLIHSANSKGKNSGFAGYAQYLYTTNAVQAYWTQSVVTKNYQNEMGFASRLDVIGTTPGFVTNLRGKWLPLKKWVRAFQPDAAAEFYHQASTGKLIESSIALYPFWILLHSGGFFGYSFTPTYQKLNENFNPLGLKIEKGIYRYTRSTFYINSDPSKKLSYSLIYDFGKYFDGRLKSTTLSVALSPIPHIFVKLSLSNNQFKHIGNSDTSANITLYTLESRLAVNPRFQVNGLLQYNNQSKITAYNIRLSWEYKPLSYLFLVFNSRNTSSLQKQLQQDGIIKFSYLKQF